MRISYPKNSSANMFSEKNVHRYLANHTRIIHIISNKNSQNGISHNIKRSTLLISRKRKCRRTRMLLNLLSNIHNYFI